MKYNFPYTLHDFLDRELAIYNGNPPEEILHAKKKEYRKMYAQWYRREYYSRMKQVTLQFTKTELGKLKSNAKALGIKRLSGYIKLMLKSKEGVTADLHLIQTKLMELIDVIESCMHEEDLERLSECLAIVESIQTELR